MTSPRHRSRSAAGPAESPRGSAQRTGLACSSSSILSRRSRTRRSGALARCSRVYAMSPGLDRRDCATRRLRTVLRGRARPLAPDLDRARAQLTKPRWLFGGAFPDSTKAPLERARTLALVITQDEIVVSLAGMVTDSERLSAALDFFAAIMEPVVGPPYR